MKCPECQSKNLVKFGKRWVPKFIINKGEPKKIRIKGQQYQCNDCGRITVKPVES